LAAAEEFVAVLYDLVGSTDQINIILLQERLDHGLSEGVGHSTIVFAPARLSLLGIGPEKVAKKTVFRHLGRPSDPLQLCDGHELWGQAAVHTEDLVVDQGGDRHAIEDVLEFFPDSDRVAALALVVEAVDTIDLATLVVASEEEEVLLELHFVGKKEDDGL